MKNALLSALLITAGLSAVPAFAADNSVATTTQVPKTRAEVRAELARAVAAGQVPIDITTYPAQFQPGYKPTMASAARGPAVDSGAGASTYGTSESGNGNASKSAPRAVTTESNPNFTGL